MLHRLTDTERAKWSTRPGLLGDRIDQGDVACDCGCGRPATIPTVTGLNGTSMAHAAECWGRWWTETREERLAAARDMLNAALASA